MSAERDLAKLASLKGTYRYSEIESLLKHFGFTDRRTTHTVMWKHPLLKGSGPFPNGLLQIGRHFDGVDGQSSSSDAQKAFKAITWVLDKIREAKEQQ